MLHELREVIDSLPYQHPTIETNIEAVELDGTGAQFLVDDSESTGQIADLRNDLAEKERECDELSSQLDGWKSRAINAEALLAEVKSEAPADKGCTLQLAIARAERAEEAADKAAQNAVAWSHEVTALRKRKGVSANLFRCEREILTLLGRLREYPEQGLKDVPALLAKLHVNNHAKPTS